MKKRWTTPLRKGFLVTIGQLWSPVLNRNWLTTLKWDLIAVAKGCLNHLLSTRVSTFTQTTRMWIKCSLMYHYTTWNRPKIPKMPWVLKIISNMEFSALLRPLWTTFSHWARTNFQLSKILRRRTCVSVTMRGSSRFNKTRCLTKNSSSTGDPLTCF